jgi:hypothetical protein
MWKKDFSQSPYIEPERFGWFTRTSGDGGYFVQRHKVDLNWYKGLKTAHRLIKRVETLKVSLSATLSAHTSLRATVTPSGFKHAHFSRSESKQAISKHYNGLLTGVVPIKRYWFIETQCQQGIHSSRQCPDLSSLLCLA